MIKEFTITLALEGREVGVVKEFKQPGQVLLIDQNKGILKDLESLERIGVVRKVFKYYLLTALGKEILKDLQN